MKARQLHLAEWSKAWRNTNI